MSFKKGWLNADGEIEIPLHVVVQTIVEMHMTACAWGVVACLVVDRGIELHILDVPEVDGLMEQLIEANKDFWRLVEMGERPPLDYSRDLSLVAKLNKPFSDKTVDLSHDNSFAAAIQDYLDSSQQISLLSKRKARAETEIRDKLGDASAAEAGDFFVSAKLVHRAAHQVAATSYRQLRVKYRGMS
jgi:predicted phage-related endonuclease